MENKLKQEIKQRQQKIVNYLYELEYQLRSDINIDNVDIYINELNVYYKLIDKKQGEIVRIKQLLEN
jgi:hypothetical protein